MAKKLRVGVIFGGRSGEHEVSLVSATSVLESLDKNKYEIIPIGIEKTGRWIAGSPALKLLKDGKNAAEQQVFLPADPNEQALIAKSPQSVIPESALKLDVVIPIVHGTHGEDGTLQGLLELADLAFVGAGVLGSAISMDKIVQKHICRQLGLPGVDFRWFRGIDWRENSNDKDRPLLPDQLANMNREEMMGAIVAGLELPVFVKPPNLGSSVGISKAHNLAELQAAIEEALQYDDKVIIEKAVHNAREIEVGVLGNEHPRASLAGEVMPSNEFYDYDAKYVDGHSGFQIPADLPKDVHSAIRRTAIHAFLACECEGMARVDFLLEKNTNRFYLSELNTIPGFTSISMYPKLWQASGLDYPALLDELIRLALERHERRHKLRTSYEPKKDWHRG